ncbi:MAG: hypothetical protein CVV13_07820 [Gammaproteobacteria bacterium HGW-Gammaproteobacteria-3]|jgi:hypothetical protein|nr:MAG: hypothetical protein CVV13_07820 [Gammaproteobacteria bacterium HGW-Gammaproteobacteria-3]
MKPTFLSKTLLLTGLIALALAGTAHAHTAIAPLGDIDDQGSNTAVADITCFNDGNGEPDHLLASIKDLSPPVPGLLINLQMLKGKTFAPGQPIIATSTTDPVSGDTEASDYILLHRGGGVYTIMLNKTGPGTREFELVWHCNAADGTHTGTDIVVTQYQ